MAAAGNGSAFVTAGLPVGKNIGDSPAGNGSAFVTAGLPAEVLVAVGGVVILRRRIEGE